VVSQEGASSLTVLLDATISNGPRMCSAVHCSASAFESKHGMRTYGVYFTAGEEMKARFPKFFQCSQRFATLLVNPGIMHSRSDGQCGENQLQELMHTCFQICVRESIHLPRHAGANIE